MRSGASHGALRFPVTGQVTISCSGAGSPGVNFARKSKVGQFDEQLILGRHNSERVCCQENVRPNRARADALPIRHPSSSELKESEESHFEKKN